jgi:GH24 family phage-related lysozyme (muramidase)
MKIDAEGIKFIESKEGTVLHSYKDSVGVWTIGCGMTYYPVTGKKVQSGDLLKRRYSEADLFIRSITNENNHN